MAFRPLPKLGQPKRAAKPGAIGGSQRYTIRKTLNYTRIRSEIVAAIAALPAMQRDSIPAAATLPEQMVGLALAWLGYLPGLAQAQITADGGRLRIGGSVVDWLVFLGGSKVAIRVQGDYWHSFPDRKLQDSVQYERLRRLRYLVVDIWENAAYAAWNEGRLKTFVAEKLAEAA